MTIIGRLVKTLSHFLMDGWQMFTLVLKRIWFYL